MIKATERPDGTMMYEEGPGIEPVPIDDDELVALLRGLQRFQGVLDADKSPTAVADAMVRSGARLLVRLAATMGHRLQQAFEAIETLEEAQGEGAGDAITITADEARTLVTPLIAAANTFGAMAGQIESANPPPENAAELVQTYRNIQASLGQFGSMLGFKLRAIELAEAEEANEEEPDPDAGDADGEEASE